jgi:TPR repeat protein
MAMKQKLTVFLTFKDIFGMGMDDVKVPFTLAQVTDVFRRKNIPLDLMYENIKEYLEDYPEESEKYREVWAYLEDEFQSRHIEDIPSPDALNLEMKAEQGDMDAQYNLGFMYGTGQGVPQDYEEAAKWCQEAAEQGYPPAQLELGRMYATGEGVPVNFVEAFRWFRTVAEQGDAQVQFTLGVMYRSGEGVTPDFGESVRWFRAAAEQGFAEAQNALGRIYEQGKGIPQDQKEAVRWYREAAEQGNVRGQVNLGFMYACGEGVAQNYKMAYMWFTLVLNGPASEDRYIAIENRDLTAVKMTPEDIDEAQQLAHEWKPTGLGSQQVH